MEQKTKIHAEDNQQFLVVTRAFDLPVHLLFRAYTEAELVEQWMGTRVLHLENRKFGSYQFETTDPKGNVHIFSGVIHEHNFNQKITRTFEMENTPYPVQLEFLTFESDGIEKSRLNMHIVYKTVADRDNMLKLPFAYGINMAHDRIQEIFNQIK